MKHKVCYLDCTETITYNNNTGIQRCVRNILSRLESVHSRHNISVVPVIALMGRYYQYDLNRNAKMVKVLSTVFGTTRDILDNLRARFRGASANTATKTDHGYATSYVGFIQLCRKIMPFFYWIAYQVDGAFVTRTHIRFRDDDVLFIADAFWNENTLQALANCHSNNIYLLLYDVIPLMAPHLCDDSHVHNFKNNFNGIISKLTGIFTISRSEMENVAAYCASISENIRYDYFHLGADFIDGCDENALDSAVKKVFKNGNVYVMVGTIEPRKNHVCVLDAFEKLWERGLNVTLCIIGKIGWKSSNILNRITSHSQLGNKLFLLNGIADQELHYCYRKCSGVIFASLAEGFGLPLVEGMHCGKPVLASDIPVFHEVGGNYPAFFPAHDSLQLANLVTKNEIGELPLPSPRPWLTWDESIEMLFDRFFLMSDYDVIKTSRR